MNMANKDSDSFWNYDRQLFLIEAVRKDPALWNVDPDVQNTAILQKLEEIGLQMGASGSECLQTYKKLCIKYHSNRKKLLDGKKTKVKWEFFDKMSFLDGTKHIEGYVNDGFNSASSESEDGFSKTSSTVTKGSRKRPHSPKSPAPRIFRRAADYIVAELENMEQSKAEVLLNKTLKFFVEHRYD